ncbi:MAG: Unknown protein [uncultured Sulfurovum sp.]|uniref:Uncharacterized protein n=1 Tax=uncultured Sulfurovum sp. TaxID=269237 RepID=A0A6S6SYH3_9BACT|nr:MAG: Unknown protein [uncultured Sulfurovum sp.]
MKEEYDFSNGERGKFYNKDATFNLPIYLEPEIESFVAQLAKEQKKNISEIVNALLFKDKELIELMRIR